MKVVFVWTKNWESKILINPIEKKNQIWIIFLYNV